MVIRLVPVTATTITFWAARTFLVEQASTTGRSNTYIGDFPRSCWLFNSLPCCSRIDLFGRLYCFLSPLVEHWIGKPSNSGDGEAGNLFTSKRVRTLGK
ncbi:UNVERIFIED_CONTAM: hypothetical protein Sangu_1606500 [Sesamum angustifolium]|uniref:Secreted protein n=1 Tax=Sesamum angustifolium TaxID=2727405 RepID=A0AAW2MIT5_9LAMI